MAQLPELIKNKNRMAGYRGLAQLPESIRPTSYNNNKNRMAGYRGLAQLPESIRPTLLRTLDLPIIDTWFIHADVRDKGLKK